ncbi:DUF6929 family protein [Flavobacterium sp.]|uniref:DUF6929 family protein n=1 Tax=Flavobacterium sp. TaxID=239 RepID=UPI003D0D7A0F
MEKFELFVFLTLKGIGSASGILSYNDHLYLISDNSTYLYEYHQKSETLNKIALTPQAQDNIPKKEKPDFEAITQKGNKLLLFGSGSTDKRCQTVSFHLKSKEIKTKDLSALYQTIKSQCKLDSDELNIEGALYFGKNLLLFQRGNGNEGKNGIIRISDEDTITDFTTVTLPKIKNVATTFTDAILVQDTIYFLASAEDTTSTYHDGEVLGSIIGTLNPKTLQLENTLQISGTHKFEGLTLFHSSENNLEFLLCEDNDTDDSNAKIYKLKVSKKLDD